MIRIGIPRNVHESYSWWRVMRVARSLEKTDIRFEVFDPRKRMEYLKYDLIHLHMPFAKEIERVLLTAEQMGVKLWYDLDDTPFHVPFSSDVWYDCYRSKERILSILKRANIITCSTAVIFEFVNVVLDDQDIYIDRIHRQILMNHITYREFDYPHVPSDRGSRRTVVWRGGDSHVENGELLMAEFKRWEELEGCVLHIFGMRLPRYTPGQFGGKKVYYHPFKDWWTYMTELKSIRPHLMFTCWDDIAFNTAKSDIVWQEATMVGAVLAHNDLMQFKDRPTLSLSEITDIPDHNKRLDLFEESWSHIKSDEWAYNQQLMLLLNYLR